MTDSSSYAKLPFCSVQFSVTENASSQPGNLFRHVHAKKDSLLRFFTYHKLLSNWQKAKSRKAVKPLAWLQSLPPLVLLATTAVRGHWENVFETPILISSHSGSRTTAEKRQKENEKGQFKATSSHCSRQTTRKKEMISCWGSKVYFPFHFLGNVKWLSIQPTGNNIGPIDYFAIETKFFAGSAFSCEISIWFWK